MESEVVSGALEWPECRVSLGGVPFSSPPRTGLAGGAWLGRVATKPEGDAASECLNFCALAATLRQIASVRGSSIGRASDSIKSDPRTNVATEEVRFAADIHHPPARATTSGIFIHALPASERTIY